MNVLHFVDSYGELTQTFVRQFHQKAAVFGYSHVATFRAENPSSDITVLKPIHHRRRQLIGLLRYFVDRLSYRKRWEAQFLNILCKKQIDIVHCHFGYNAIHLLSLIEKGLIESKVIISFYGYDISGLVEKDATYRKDILKLFSHKNVYAFGEGPELCKKIVSHFGQKEKVLINPLIVKTKKNRHLRKNKSSLRFLMVGRFLEKKGFHLAIEALGKLKNVIGEFEITIIGFGIMKPVYLSLIDKYGVGDKVTFEGKKSHEEVLASLEEHDFFIHPSLTASDGDSEGGAPTIIIEAQACGIPVIASNHADIPYIMGYHDFLSEEGDLESLQIMIKKALSTLEIEDLIEKGISHIQKQHCFELSTTYEDNLKQIIDNFKTNN